MIKAKKIYKKYSIKENVDFSTFDYISHKYKINSMVDIGCGHGGMVQYAIGRNMKAVGIDCNLELGFFEEKEYIFHNYAKGKFILDDIYDLGWSVEFLEHVEEEYLDNIFSTLCCCKYICCTHALPDQPGYHHVNCQSPRYWMDVFDNYGFDINKKESFNIKLITSMAGGYMKRTGMFLINRNYKS